MSIIQEQPSDPSVPSRIVAASLDPPQDLEYPHAPIPAKARNSPMPLILWGMALLLGILMLLVRTPLHAPPFESLTQYACDRLPSLPNLGNRFQSYSLNIRCRAGDTVVYQRGFPAYSNNPAWTSCRRAGGLIRIWRVANPSPYGSYVFHATCDEHVITYFRARAATYESTQRFVIVFGTLFTLLSATGLMMSLVRARRRIRASRDGGRHNGLQTPQ
jgi:hypothetical protein